MADQPLTTAVLKQFYRELIAPDFERLFARLDKIDSRLDELIARNGQRVERAPSRPASN